MKPERKNTNRISKVNSLIEHELGPVLHEFLAGQSGLVTISKVETSRDMKWVKVWVSILEVASKNTPKKQPAEAPLKPGQKKKKILNFDQKILNFLNENIYDIQGEMNKHFATKIIPKLQFFLDTSPRYAQHISELIEKVHHEEEDEKSS